MTNKPTNLRSALRRARRSGGRKKSPMEAFDALPPPARRWLAQAALPWSAASVARAWHKALRRSDGCEAQAARMLSQRESARLQKDAPETWGAGYPL